MLARSVYFVKAKKLNVSTVRGSIRVWKNHSVMMLKHDHGTQLVAMAKVFHRSSPTLTVLQCFGFRYHNSQCMVFCVLREFLFGMRNGGKKFWAALFTITRKEPSGSAGCISRRTDATAAWLVHYFPNIRTIGAWVMSSHVILMETLTGSVSLLIRRRWCRIINKTIRFFLRYLNASWKKQWFAHPNLSHRTMENAKKVQVRHRVFFSEKQDLPWFAMIWIPPRHIRSRKPLWAT